MIKFILVDHGKDYERFLLHYLCCFWYRTVSSRADIGVPVVSGFLKSTSFLYFWVSLSITSFLLTFKCIQISSSLKNNITIQIQKEKGRENKISLHTGLTLTCLRSPPPLHSCRFLYVSSPRLHNPLTLEFIVNDYNSAKNRLTRSPSAPVVKFQGQILTLVLPMQQHPTRSASPQPPLRLP